MLGIALVFCSQCGTENDDNARYCRKCRATLRVQSRDLDKELSDLTWKLRLALANSKLSEFKWLNRLMSKKLTDDESRVEMYKYLIERIEYSSNNPTLPTGIQVLDDILYGGIPKGYCILLTSPTSDERDKVIESYLLQGIEKNESVLLLTTILKSKSNNLVMNRADTFNLVLCSPWADNIISDKPNVLKFNGVDDLTQLNISLKVFLREINKKGKSIDRVVLDLLSDTILMHDTRVIRRWLMDLITLFKQSNMTTIATLDPGMHSPEETRIITDLFDGHLNISDRKISVKRLYNKKYQNSVIELNYS